MKRIPLTQGQFTTVDDDVFEWASKVSWCAARRKNTFYAVRQIRVSQSGAGRQKTLRLHREILGLKAPKVQGAHLDGNGLNNLRKNLRPATNRQNMQSFRTPLAGKSSRFRGVTWHRKDRKWQASIVTAGKSLYLGQFEAETDAARAYDAAATKYFGEFTQLNFPA